MTYAFLITIYVCVCISIQFANKIEFLYREIIVLKSVTNVKSLESSFPHVGRVYLYTFVMEHRYQSKLFKSQHSELRKSYKNLYLI